MIVDRQRPLFLITNKIIVIQAMLPSQAIQLLNTNFFSTLPATRAFFMIEVQKFSERISFNMDGHLFDKSHAWA